MAQMQTKTLSYVVTICIAYLLIGVGLEWFKIDLNILRWYVSIYCLYLAIKTFYDKNWKWLWWFVILVFVFNPFERVLNFSKSTWGIIDFVTALSLLLFVFDYYRAYAKGVRFEKYISSLFPKNIWVLTDRTKDSSKNLKRLVESDMNPDFTFRHIPTGKIIAIECKFRSRFFRGKYGDNGYWWKKEQGKRYTEYGEKMNIPVFIALGVGGTPRTPNNLFLCPLDTLNNAPYGFVTEKILKPFERKTNEKIVEYLH